MPRPTLNPDSIKTIRTAWERGDGTLPELAAIHNVNLLTLKSRAAREQWGKTRTAVQQAVKLTAAQHAQQVAAELASQAATLTRNVIKDTEAALKVIRAKLTGDGAAKLSPKELADLANAFRSNVAEQRRALGLADEAEAKAPIAINFSISGNQHIGLGGNVVDVPSERIE